MKNLEIPVVLWRIDRSTPRQRRVQLGEQTLSIENLLLPRHEFNKLDAMLWSPISMHRGMEHLDHHSAVSYVHAMVLDIDSAPEKVKANGRFIDGVLNTIRDIGVSFAWHDTYSSELDARKIRVVIPLGDQLTPQEHLDLWKRLYVLTGRCMDLRCANPNRSYFFPSSPWAKPIRYPEFRTGRRRLRPSILSGIDISDVDVDPTASVNYVPIESSNDTTKDPQADLDSFYDD